MSSDLRFQYPQPLVTPATEQHTATVIMLHGLGDRGSGWAEIGHGLRMPWCKFVFPTAPTRPITLNGGYRMTGWYDIASLDKLSDAGDDEEGVRDSVRYVESLIDQEVAAGIPSERIVVGGFSQGGAVALMMLRSPRKLAAILALSTYLMLR